MVPPDLTKMVPARTVSEPKVNPMPTAMKSKPMDGKSKVQPHIMFKDVEIINDVNKDKFTGKPKHASPAFKFTSAA